MECPSSQAPVGALLDIVVPSGPRAPLVVASPHSGRDYPPEFLAQSILDPLSLRRSEDSFVEELFGSAPAHGAPLLIARFPRAFLDVNREPFELDPSMFDGPLPWSTNAGSPRVGAGLGTIPRVVASGAYIYRDRLPAAEAERRMEACYFPYHDALARLLDETCDRFGCALLLDCHSMPATADSGDRDDPVDIVLGDCFGTSCAPTLIDSVEATLVAQGYRVIRNAPYAGGFTTRHYGRPTRGLHALQIELKRTLYMDESTHLRTPHFSRLERDMNELIGAIVAMPMEDFLP